MPRAFFVPTSPRAVLVRTSPSSTTVPIVVPALPFDLSTVLQQRQWPVTRQLPIAVQGPSNASGGGEASGAAAKPSSTASSTSATAASPRFAGTLDAMYKLVKHEGVTSLWRGLQPTILLSIPSTVIYFWTYDEMKLSLQALHQQQRSATALAEAHLSTSSSPSSPSSLLPHLVSTSLTATLGALPPSLVPLVSGTTARALSTVVVSPIELIRTKTQALSHNTNMIDLVRDEVRRGGWRSLWRGAVPTLWRDVPFSACYWTAYERIKSALLHDVSNACRVTTMSPEEFQRRLAWISFLSGACSGLLSAVVTHPFDLVKTRRQIDMYHLLPSSSSGATHVSAASAASPAGSSATTTWRVLRTIVQEEGWRGLRSGLTARLTKIVPACAIMVSTYEVAKSQFGHLEHHRFDDEPRSAVTMTNPHAVNNVAVATVTAVVTNAGSRCDDARASSSRVADDDGLSVPLSLADMSVDVDRRSNLDCVQALSD